MNDLRARSAKICSARSCAPADDLSILIAFAIFGVLAELRARLRRRRRTSPRADRLVVVNKINFTQPLPIAYFNRVRGIDGVRAGHPSQLVRRLLSRTRRTS